jgi:hypothetical protein
METSTIPVKAFSGEHVETGEVVVTSWDKASRLKRALKILCLLWIGAVVSIVIPGLHFILVPGLFLAGPIAAYFLYRQESAVSGGTIQCPSCKNTIPVVRSPNSWPINVVCPRCNGFVRLER